MLVRQALKRLSSLKIKDSRLKNKEAREVFMILLAYIRLFLNRCNTSFCCIFYYTYLTTTLSLLLHTLIVTQHCYNVQSNSPVAGCDSKLYQCRRIMLRFYEEMPAVASSMYFTFFPGVCLFRLVVFLLTVFRIANNILNIYSNFWAHCTQHTILAQRTLRMTHLATMLNE